MMQKIKIKQNTRTALRVNKIILRNIRRKTAQSMWNKRRLNEILQCVQERWNIDSANIAGTYIQFSLKTQPWRSICVTLKACDVRTCAISYQFIDMLQLTAEDCGSYSDARNDKCTTTGTNKSSTEYVRHYFHQSGPVNWSSLVSLHWAHIDCHSILYFMSNFLHAFWYFQRIKN